MPYNIPEVRMPDVAGGFMRGLSFEEGRQEKKRKQSLADYAREQQEVAGLNEDMQKFGVYYQQLAPEQRPAALEGAKQLWSAEFPSAVQNYNLDDESLYFGGAGMQDRPTLKSGRVFEGTVGGQNVFLRDDPTSPTGYTVLEGATPLDKTTMAIERARGVESEKTKAMQEREEKLKSKQLEFSKKEAELAKMRSEQIKSEAAKGMAGRRAVDTIESVDFLANSDLDKIYGKEEAIMPNILYDQESQDMLGRMANIVSVLQMVGRGELKGGGSISDAEMKIASDAATILGNNKISPNLARKELNRVNEILRKAAIEGGQEVEATKKDTPTKDVQSLVDKYAN